MLECREAGIAISVVRGYNQDMEKRIYKEEQVKTGKWSGGTTTEFAIFPEKAQYIERDFIWRLSSAQVDLEESSFTRLEDYDRILMVLEGEAVLAHGDQRTVKLGALEQDSFDGGIKTRCFGKIKDYNLMFRKGCSGSLHLMDVASDAKAVETGEQGDFSNASYGFYCLSGYAVISVGGETLMLQEGTQLVLDFAEGEAGPLMAMGDGKLIVAEVFYTIQAHVAEEIPEEKATFEDFKMAARLVRKRQKWSQAIGRKEDVWYDEALQAKLAFLDRTYIGFILWGVVTILLVTLVLTEISHAVIIGLIIGWTILYGLVISPLIYMLVLPKPIKAHIKRVDSLTEYEQKLYERDKDDNPELDKIFRKYKHSKGQGWDVAEQESVFSRRKK